MGCFQTDLQKYIHISKYAKWIEDEKRRETWEESVERFIDFWENQTIGGEGINDAMFDPELLGEIEKSILRCDIMPSMRGLMTAGKALERDNIAQYNCTAIAVTHPAVFSEAFYILMNGCGFGFSVERQYINKLPEVAEELFETDTTLIIRDSKIGWATGMKELISMLYNGQIPKWDLSKVRPAGARLKTFGGRASGPEPLDRLFHNTVKLFISAKGRKLTSIECHDLMCHIADTVIVGSVRRAALISLSNLTDDRMRRAKDGQWWMIAPQRALANNSVAYTEKPDLDSFSKEWRTLYKSKSGERGIWNKEGAKKIAEDRGREYDGDYIPNPCGEVSIRDSGGVCNLTEVIIRPNDSFGQIKKKIRLATIMGTIQATLTNFRFLRKVWKTNAEEERLLGVSFTGIMDHPIFNGNAHADYYHEWSKGKAICLEELLKYLHDYAHNINKEWAKKFGINSTGHVCVVKPSGTVSILTGTSSGIHPRYGKYYIRRVRNDKKDPLSQLMIDEGIPFVDEGDKYVFTFYVKSPDHAVIQKDIGAIRQLEIWKIYKEYWCDGNPSQTIYYTDDDYFAIADWLWNNWDSVGGLSFFPYTDDSTGVYANAPLEEITEEEYNKGIKTFPKKINWDRLVEFEYEDGTTASQEFACAGGKCEL
jgi:ribonucleoside-diphosphate reductase alpha chain